MAIIESVYNAVSVDANAGISADVDAAVAAASGLRLVGVTARESASSAAAATIGIINGATVSGGSTVAVIELGENGSETLWLWPGIDCSDGLSIDVIAGTADVYLYYTQVV